MSANSRHVMRCVPIVVPPQAINDRSIYDSVAGFINDVALTNTQQGDPKDTILWTKFESTADISDLSYGDDWDLEGRVAPPLLLILGYPTGIQVWAIPANGEAFEILAWRHGSVKSLRILPTPLECDIELADEPSDQYTHKRPLMAICDSTATGSGPQFCSINFISLKTKEQVKTIKFKNPVLDILANRSSIAVTFPEKIAVFDARTLEDRLTITTCHLSPGLNPNPVALGTRWMAYAERKLLPSKRSSGGCDYDGVSSYTATVLNAAKSLTKGLRELGETVAAGLSGTGSHLGGQTSSTSATTGNTSVGADKRQPGIITILDIKYPIKDTSPVSGAPISSNGDDRIIAHFVAHSDAIVALTFDCSGMLLISADKRGHDFHVFRIHAHPGGPSMSAVHHLYVLHRGDTTSKVQDIVFSLDSRWVAVSTLRGTTHVFPVTTYGGPAGVRTHGSSHVVNRLSRFHRSAGLSIDSRSSSPISHSEYSLTQTTSAYPNPRTPPFPHPTIVGPLAQLRLPVNIGNPTGSGQMNFNKSGQGRQRVSSISEDSTKPLRVCAAFARPRAWLLESGTTIRDPQQATKLQNKTVDSLFIMTGYGALIQYDLDPKPISNIPKEKVCDDTPIELEVEAKAQWTLLRHDESTDIQPPLSSDNLLLKERFNDCSGSNVDRSDDRDDVWLSQVEIITHAGPHRRLWMGPQFMFKTYNTPSGSSLSTIESESVEIGVGTPGNRPARSNPVNMPPTNCNRSAVSVLIESSSYSSIEQSPRMTQLHYEQSESSFSVGSGENQLREDLADAMRESSGAVPLIEAGSDKSTTPFSSGSVMSSRTPCVSIAKVVNPLGTVTTILNTIDDTIDEYEIPIGHCSDQYVHENCDEALFRPVVTVLGNSAGNDITEKKQNIERPAPMGLDLIVPVMEERQKVLIKPKPKIIIEKKSETSIDPIESKPNEIQKLDEFSSKHKIKTNKIKTSFVDEKQKEKKKFDEEMEKVVSKPIETQLRAKKKSQKIEKFSIEEPIKIREKATKISRAIQDAVQETKIESKKREKIEKIDFPPLFPDDDPIIEDPIETEAFSELYKTAFSIQESLTKNSDYIVKRTKIHSPKTDFQPLPMEEILDFNIMSVEQNMDESLVQPNSFSCEIEKEQFFDTDATSKFELDFAESIFSEPLAPLESFVDTFERLSYKDTSELMNFESPEHDDDLDLDDMLPISKEHFTEANLVFADCTNLQDDDDDDDKQVDTETTTTGLGDNNSSDDTEDSFNEKKEQKLEEDEELQPLISTATTSSDTTPNFSKAIIDSLPDNQKESNKQQQQQQNNNNNKKKPRRKKR